MIRMDRSSADILINDIGSTVIANPTETITITALGVGGFCKGDASVSITLLIDEDEFYDAGPDDEICIGSSTTLNGDGGDFESDFYGRPQLVQRSYYSKSGGLPTTTTTYTSISQQIYMVVLKPMR